MCFQRSALNVLYFCDAVQEFQLRGTSGTMTSHFGECCKTKESREEEVCKRKVGKYCTVQIFQTTF